MKIRVVESPFRAYLDHYIDLYDLRYAPFTNQFLPSINMRSHSHEVVTLTGIRSSE